MKQRQYGTSCKLDIFETEPDIQQHADGGDDNSDKCILLHLLADRTGDALRRDLLGFYAEIIDHCLI